MGSSQLRLGIVLTKLSSQASGKTHFCHMFVTCLQTTMNVLGILYWLLFHQFRFSNSTTKLVFCRRGSIKADVELIFNEGSSNLSASSAADSLTEAVSGGNFSLPVDTSSIVATGILDLLYLYCIWHNYIKENCGERLPYMFAANPMKVNMLQFFSYCSCRSTDWGPGYSCSDNFW